MYDISTINGISLKDRWQVKQGDRLTPGQLGIIKNEALMQMRGVKSTEIDSYWLEESGSNLLNEKN